MTLDNLFLFGEGSYQSLTAMHRDWCDCVTIYVEGLNIGCTATLDRQKATELRDWLNKYLGEVPP